MYKQYASISFARIIAIDLYRSYEDRYSRARAFGLEGAEQLIRSGHVGIIFLELNWAKKCETTCAATESIRFLEQAGYRFSRPGKRLNWEKAGDWLRVSE